MLQNKILTLDNFQKRGINVVNRCILCKEGFEDRDNLFLNCSYSQLVWAEILNFWGIIWVHQNKVELTFRSWFCPSKDPDVLFLWKLTLPHLWWGIWKERNNQIFRSKDLPRWVLGQNVIKAIKENFKSQRFLDKTFHFDNPL